MECGAQFVMTLGMILMLEWCVLRWDTQDKVCNKYYYKGDIIKCYFIYILGSVSQSAAYFGSSSYGPVSIGSIQCSGSETRLQDCGLSQTPGSSCTHSQDAGVTCVGKRGMHVLSAN